MAFLLKPGLLEKATNAADIQKLMKSDLKNNVGKKGVKFIAAKNAVIGGKTVQLFIVTDNAAPFETYLKAKQPKAYRAQGSCDLEKDESGNTKVTIKTSAGQMAPDAVVKLVPEVVGHDKAFTAQFEPATGNSLQNPPQLKKAPQVKRDVAEWAKNEYKLESVETLIASKTPDGKIGSVYFGDEGRIRTTHVHGPDQSKHDNQTIVQFNIDQSQAKAAFRDAHKNDNPPLYTLDQDDYNLAWKKFLQTELTKATPSTVPSWAKMVTGPDTAHDVSKDGAITGMQLIEIFKGINDRYEGWHPSRGAATKFVTDTQTVAVLNAAIKDIDAKYAKVNALESTDAEIVKRREEIEKLYQTARANPTPKALKGFLAKPSLSRNITTLSLRLNKPAAKLTIGDLDSDDKIRTEIDASYKQATRDTIKNDKQIANRMKVLGELRNKAFYEFVSNRLPNSAIVNAMRKP